MAPKKTSQSANSNTGSVTEQQAGQPVSKHDRDKAPCRTHTRASKAKAKGELPTPLASFEI